MILRKKSGKIYSYTVIGLLLAIIGLILYSSFQGYQLSAAAADGLTGDDMVTAWDKRLRKIRNILPEYGTIGYVADWDIPGYKYGSSDQEVEFLLAQYTVAPVVLERGTDHDLILGNFSDNGDPQKMETVQKQLGLKIIQTYSNEIFLMERQEK